MNSGFRVLLTRNDHRVQITACGLTILLFHQNYSKAANTEEVVGYL